MDDNLETFYAEWESVIDERGYNAPKKETKMTNGIDYVEVEFSKEDTEKLIDMINSGEQKSIMLPCFPMDKSSSVFKDQEKMMLAYGQTVDKWNDDQSEMYLGLVEEEFGELEEACLAYSDSLHDEGTITEDDAKTEILDALIDIIVVTIGAGLSMGFDMNSAWREVFKNNMSKVDKVTGKVIRRESDGKVLKPDGWTPPNLKQFIGTSK